VTGQVSLRLKVVHKLVDVVAVDALERSDKLTTLAAVDHGACGIVDRPPEVAAPELDVMAAVDHVDRLGTPRRRFWTSRCWLSHRCPRRVEVHGLRRRQSFDVDRERSAHRDEVALVNREGLGWVEVRRQDCGR